MTPDDVAGLRAQDAAAWRHRDILALCDALESSWAERDDRKEAARTNRQLADRLIERAERAEQRENVAREALAEATEAWMSWQDRAERAEAELKRLREEGQL